LLKDANQKVIQQAVNKSQAAIKNGMTQVAKNVNQEAVKAGVTSKSVIETTKSIINSND